MRYIPTVNRSELYRHATTALKWLPLQNFFCPSLMDVKIKLNPGVSNAVIHLMCKPELRYRSNNFLPSGKLSGCTCSLRYVCFQLCVEKPKVVIIEIIDIECGLLSRVSQKIVATKWRIYKGKISSPQDILCKSKR